MARLSIYDIKDQLQVTLPLIIQNRECDLCGGEHGNNTNCQRNDFMKITPDIKSSFDSVIDSYAKLGEEDTYELDLKDIPDYELHKLAGLIISKNDDYASESTGPDNDDYDKSMLPALINFMKDPHDEYKQEDFLEAWKRGVLNYLTPSIERILKERLLEYNEHYGYFPSNDDEVEKVSFNRLTM